MESAPVFLPSTSSYSFSSWFNSSCAHHLSPDLFLSLRRPFTPNLKLVFHKSYPPQSCWLFWILTRLSGHWLFCKSDSVDRRCRGDYSASKNSRRQHPLLDNIIYNSFPEICAPIIFWLVDQSSTFSSNIGGVVVDQMFFLIFVLSIRSEDIRDQSQKLSEKTRRILDVLPSQILGGGSVKSCSQIITPVSRHVAWKSFVRLLPLAPKVIDTHTLNFTPNCKCSPSTSFGDPVPVWSVR